MSFRTLTHLTARHFARLPQRTMTSQNTRYIAPAQGSRLVASSTSKPTADDPGEVVIRLKAIAINPVDVNMIDKGLRVASWPLVPGMDGAGVVEEVGAQVEGVAVGDRVLAMFAPGGRAGTFQELAVVRQGMAARIPDSWAFEDAATLAVCYFTAMIGLGIGLKTPLPFLENGPASGFTPSSVLVLGGSSALGAATIQLLQLALPGCTVLTTASPKHNSHLTGELGAHGVIDRSSATLAADVHAATPGSKGVEAIIDVVGAGASQGAIFDAFDPSGPRRYAQVWTGDDEIRAPEGVDSVLFRSRDAAQLPGSENIMKALQGLLAEGRYKLPLPVRRVGEGFEALEAGLDVMRKGVSGEKLVIVV